MAPGRFSPVASSVAVDIRPVAEGHEADGYVGFIAKRVGDRRLGIADPDIRSRNKLQRPCHLRVDDDAAVRKRRGKLPAAAKLGSTDKQPGRIDGFQRHQLALVAHCSIARISRLADRRPCPRQASCPWRRNIEAAARVAAKKKLRVAGNAASHRLARSDGADGGDRASERRERHGIWQRNRGFHAAPCARQASSRRRLKPPSVRVWSCSCGAA